MNLVTAMVLAPLTGIRPGENVMHAVDAEALAKGWGDGRVAAPCGEVVGLLSIPLGSENAVPWPPSVRTLPEGWSRCRECHALTGKKRPRCDFAVRGAA